ncbi:MAG: hypothetical protein ACOC7W_05055 [Desulfosalsimonas sp.]
MIASLGIYAPDESLQKGIRRLMGLFEGGGFRVAEQESRGIAPVV